MSNAIVFRPGAGPSPSRPKTNLSNEINKLRMMVRQIKYTVNTAKPSNKKQFIIRRKEVLKKKQLLSELNNITTKFKKGNSIIQDLKNFKVQLNNVENLFNRHKNGNVRITNNDNAAWQRSNIINREHNATRQNTKNAKAIKKLASGGINLTLLGSTNFKRMFNEIVETTRNKKELENKIINLFSQLKPGEENKVINAEQRNLTNTIHSVNFTQLNNQERQYINNKTLAVSLLRNVVDMSKYNSFLNYMLKHNPGDVSYNITNGKIYMTNNPEYFNKWSKMIGTKVPLEMLNPIIRPNIGRNYTNKSATGYSRQNAQNFRTP